MANLTPSPHHTGTFLGTSRSPCLPLVLTRLLGGGLTTPVVQRRKLCSKILDTWAASGLSMATAS